MIVPSAFAGKAFEHCPFPAGAPAVSVEYETFSIPPAGETRMIHESITSSAYQSFVPFASAVPRT